MSHSTIEIIGARERRRRWSVEAKLRIVAETFECRFQSIAATCYDLIAARLPI
jgi:transposase-like protein